MLCAVVRGEFFEKSFPRAPFPKTSDICLTSRIAFESVIIQFSKNEEPERKFTIYNRTVEFQFTNDK
jgi:hypothetical protein